MKKAPIREALNTGITWLYFIHKLYPKYVPTSAPHKLILALVILTVYSTVSTNTIPSQAETRTIAHFFVKSRMNFESNMLTKDIEKTTTPIMGSDAS